jgi:membrane-associated phospholipid phosphatase
MKAEVIVARLFSSVFHPLIIPTLGMIVLFNLETYVAYSIPPQAKRFILGIVFINTAIAPVLSIFMLKRMRLIKDVLLDERSERFFPLLLSALYFFLTYFLLRRVSLPSIVYFYVLGATLLVLLSMVITFRWKISIHMTSMGGFTGFLIVTSLLLRTDISVLILAAILVSGLVGSSRIRLNAHSPAQVYAGYLMGVGVMLLLYMYLRV